MPKPAYQMTVCPEEVTYLQTMWKGSLSFGLVNVPVKMFAATENKDVSFKYLHKACQTPIKYTRTCPHCDVTVGWEDIVRGYEYEPDHFVVFSDEEMKELQKQRAQTIDILEFVELAEVDPIYYDKTYYLAPETSGVKAYRLLQEAMDKTGKVAVAKTVIRTKEVLACVRVGKGAIILETLFWPDEVRATAELPNIHAASEPSEKELDMAMTLINQLHTTFDAEKYTDTHREETLAAIQQKIEHDEIKTAPAAAKPAGNIVDLMAALQESIRQTTPSAADKPKRAKRAPTTRRSTAKKTS